MAKRTIVATPALRTRVLGMDGVPVRELRTWIADRAANGEGFPAEFVVRLPRRLSCSEAVSK